MCEHKITIQFVAAVVDVVKILVPDVVILVEAPGQLAGTADIKFECIHIHYQKLKYLKGVLHSDTVRELTSENTECIQILDVFWRHILSLGLECSALNPN